MRCIQIIYDRQLTTGQKLRQAICFHRFKYETEDHRTCVWCGRIEKGYWQSTDPATGHGNYEWHRCRERHGW